MPGIHGILDPVISYLFTKLCKSSKLYNVEVNFIFSTMCILTRVLLYRLKDYAIRRTDLNDVDESLIGDLTDLENELLRSQDLMVVRGKVSSLKCILSIQSI